MSEIIEVALFQQEYRALLTETFEKVHGIFLDSGTSLFETLATITADQASTPISARCASIAAQVAHIDFYLEVLERYMMQETVEKVDWGEVWRTIYDVTPQQWEEIQQKLHKRYEHILELLSSIQNWQNENTLGGAMAIVVHTAYHLGEIRHALCILHP